MLAVACKSTATPPVSQPTDPESPPAAVPMAEHFIKVSVIKDAVIQGDLAATKDPAQWLLDNVVAEELPVRWRPHVPPVRRAAKQVIDANDLETAAAATGELAAACGACHADIGVQLAPTDANDPLKDDTAFAQMGRHAWAADRMWDGLIGPSDAAWNKGASMLSEAALHGDAAPKEVAGLAVYVRQLGEKGAAEPELDKRAEHYSKLIETCATCHQQLKGEAVSVLGLPYRPASF